MKPINFKQLALLILMAVTALILGLVCIAHETKERSELVGQDTAKVNKYGDETTFK